MIPHSAIAATSTIAIMKPMGFHGGKLNAFLDNECGQLGTQVGVFFFAG